jgi:hypothetical protein
MNDTERKLIEIKRRRDRKAGITDKQYTMKMNKKPERPTQKWRQMLYCLREWLEDLIWR